MPFKTEGGLRTRPGTLNNNNYREKFIYSYNYIILGCNYMKKTIKINFILILISIFIILSVNVVNSCELKSLNCSITSNEDLKEFYNNLNNYKYRLFYFGKIKDLNRQENYISFNSVNLYRISFIRSSDWSFWEYSFSHYENTFHQHENYIFIAILTNNIIFGFFLK